MSNYIKTNWQDGDIITASKMNNIENELSDLSETVDGMSGGGSVPELVNEVAALKADLNNLSNTVVGENILDSELIRNKTTNAITNNGDGTYIIGTGDYGSVIFGDENAYVLQPGLYLLYGVPSGYSFVSTTTSHTGAIFTNASSEPIWINILTETSVYIGYRNTARPSDSFTIAPYLKTEGLQKEVEDIIPVIAELTPTYNGVVPTKEAGKYLTQGGVNPWDVFSYSEAIPVKKGDVVTLTAYVSAGVTAIFYCTADLGHRKGAVGGASYDVQDYTLTVQKSGYIVCNFGTSYTHTIKIVGNEINRLKSANVLNDKTVVWCGDSIMRGDTFNDTDHGWAGRVANILGCDYFNYGIGGSTICNNVSGGSTPTIYAQVESAHTDYPDADYVIFDGGCNDADLIGSIVGGSTPQQFGTWSPTDWSGEYDTDTFCGAFETICMHLSQYWLGSHVGYIVPHKMGVTNNYDETANNYRAYYKTAIDICKKWGIGVLNLWDGCYLNPKHNWMCDTGNTMTQQEIYNAGFLYADRQHLTSEGYDYEATLVAEWIKGL